MPNCRFRYKVKEVKDGEAWIEVKRFESEEEKGNFSISKPIDELKKMAREEIEIWLRDACSVREKELKRNKKKEKEEKDLFDELGDISGEITIDDV